MKKPKREEMVIMAVCQKTNKPFGITARKVERDFVFQWAFKMSAESAKREGFDRNKVTGNIFNADEFPGCPHCGAATWFQCGRCGKFVCMNGEQKVVRCPACGNEAEVVVSDSFDLSGGDL